jgi:hypothetical protein
VGKKTLQSDNGQLDELRELVSGDEQVGKKQTDRRGMLRMAGAAMLGAAGVAALKVVPASAATGGNFILGCGNSASSDTSLVTSGGTTALLVSGGPTGIEGLGGGNTTSELGVLGVSKNGIGIGVGGRALGSGTGVRGESTTGVGVAGVATSGTGVSGDAPTNGTGVLGTSTGSGTGVEGAAANGRGVLGASTGGYDVQLGFPVVGGAVGSGRLGMVGRLDTGGSAPPIAPAFQVTSTGSYTFEHELVRGNDSSIWASRFTASGTNLSRWKRINAVRVDAADGTGAVFAPFRLYDSRSGAKPAVNSVTHVQAAGAGTGTSTIPPDAVAIIGNLTATQYTGPGFLAISPDNIAVATSSVNFITGQAAIANGFVVGLNGGRVQVKVASHASHFIIDVTGYIQ